MEKVPTSPSFCGRDPASPCVTLTEQKFDQSQNGVIGTRRKLLAELGQHAVEHRNHLIDLFGRAIQCGHKPQ